MASDCPERMVLNLLNLQDAAIDNRNYWSMDAGIAGHAALAQWLRGGNWTEAIEYYKEYSATYGMAGDRRGYGNMCNILSTIIERHPLASLPFVIDDPRYVEVPFSVSLGSVQVNNEIVEVALIGVMDACPLDRKTSQRWVLEHKFTGKLDDAFISNFTYDDPQTTAYCYAVREITGEEVAACWVNAIGMVMMPGGDGTCHISNKTGECSDRKCKDHGVAYHECGPLHIKQIFIPVRRSADELEEFRRNALHVARRAIASAQFIERNGENAPQIARRLGPFTSACSWCDFRKWCRISNRNKEMFNSMLKLREKSDRLRTGFSTV